MVAWHDAIQAVYDTTAALDERRHNEAAANGIDGRVYDMKIVVPLVRTASVFSKSWGFRIGLAFRVYPTCISQAIPHLSLTLMVNAVATQSKRPWLGIDLCDCLMWPVMAGNDRLHRTR
jgi:hypothetical protein